jgi:hypothetical protein
MKMHSAREGSRGSRAGSPRHRSRRGPARCLPGAGARVAVVLRRDVRPARRGLPGEPGEFRLVGVNSLTASTHMGALSGSWPRARPDASRASGSRVGRLPHRVVGLRSRKRRSARPPALRRRVRRPAPRRGPAGRSERPAPAPCWSRPSEAVVPPHHLEAVPSVVVMRCPCPVRPSRFDTCPPRD